MILRNEKVLNKLNVKLMIQTSTLHGTFFQTAWHSKNAVKFNLIMRGHNMLWVLKNLEGLAVLSGYDTAEIFSSKHRIHIPQGLKLCSVRRVSDFPLEMSSTFEMKNAAKATFEDVLSSEMFRVVQYVSMTFDVKFHLLFYHSRLVKGKKKTKINFQVFLCNHHKGITEALWKAFEKYTKDSPHERAKERFFNLKAENFSRKRFIFNLKNSSIYLMFVNQPYWLSFKLFCVLNFMLHLFMCLAYVCFNLWISIIFNAI